jgi:hypothetical protein
MPRGQVASRKEAAMSKVVKRTFSLTEEQARFIDGSTLD